MKNIIVFSFVIIMLLMTSCELIGDIFSAGFYTALILVGIVIAIVVYIVARMRRRR